MVCHTSMNACSSSRVTRAHSSMKLRRDTARGGDLNALLVAIDSLRPGSYAWLGSQRTWK